MEVALTALRQFSLGVVSDSTVYRAAALVAAPAPAPPPAKPETDPPEEPSSQEDATDAQALDENEGPPSAAPDAAPGGLGGVVSELYTWGRSKNYQLGYGASGEEQALPRLVPMPSGVVVTSISCGQFHSVAATSCGCVFCWGFSGTTGRLGLDSGDGSAPASCIEPARLSEFGPGRHCAVKAAAGVNHSMALTAGGALLAWGAGAQGQLGLQGPRPTGDGAAAQRPQVVKGPLKGEVVVDIAAGAAHSLCCCDSGVALAWGSNEHGALGLGAPPAGPALAATPQRLPHLRGTKAVFASAAGHGCAALVAGHGDALVWGSPPPAGRVAAGAAQPPADARHFVPSRVQRRRGRGGSAGDNETWQTAQRAAAPLRSVVLGAEAAYGVDTEGILWTWSLRGQRPCVAEEVVAALPAAGGVGHFSPLMGPTRPWTGGVSSVAVADKLGTVWVVDATPESCLWCLKRAADGWSAQRCEHLAQVSGVACGQEHQAAVVSFRRPAEAMPPPRDAAEALLPGAALEGEGEESDADDDSEADSDGRPPPVLHQPVTLQQLCEEKLCREVTPRSLGMLCEAALEFDRPLALDRAYLFLRANAALMFSKQHLPVLSQLPVEVLAAFELVAAGRFPTPSAALEAYGAGFPFEDMPLVPEALELAPKEVSSESISAKEGGGGIPKAGGQRPRKRRGSGAGGSPKLQEAGTPQLTSATPPGARAAASTPGMPPPASPAGATKAAGSSKQSRSLESPLAAPLPAPAAGGGAKAASPSAKAAPEPQQDWVAVRLRRKAGGGVGSPGSPSGLAAPAAAGAAPSPYVAATPAGPGGTSPHMESLAPPAVPMRPMPTLGDFVRPTADAAPAGRGAMLGKAGKAGGAGAAEPAEGPSAMLSAAVQSIHERPPKAAPWAAAAAGAATGEAAEAPKLREILREEGSGRGSGAAGRGPATADATTCSWGFDAMPSERPKGRSVYEIQQQETVEREKSKEEDEIREIEAMFAALEVAELADAQEQSGSAPSSSQKAPKAGKKAEKRPAGGGAKGRGGRGGEKGDKPRPSGEPKADGGERWRQDGWTSRARGRGGGGWDAWSSNGWDWQGESWQWSEPSAAGASKRWVAKQDTEE